MQRKELITIRGTEIYAVITESGHTLVPLLPICKVIGLDFYKVLPDLLSDPLIHPLLDAECLEQNEDDPERKYCLPIRYIYGWLFSLGDHALNPSTSKEDAQRLLHCCYNGIFSAHFGELKERIRSQRDEIELLDRIVKARAEEMEAHDEIHRAQRSLYNIRLARVTDDRDLPF